MFTEEAVLKLDFGPRAREVAMELHRTNTERTIIPRYSDKPSHF